MALFYAGVLLCETRNACGFKLLNFGVICSTTLGIYDSPKLLCSIFLPLASLANLRQPDEPGHSSSVSSDPGYRVLLKKTNKPTKQFSCSPLSFGPSTPPYNIFLENSLLLKHSLPFLNL